MHSLDCWDSKVVQEDGQEHVLLCHVSLPQNSKRNIQTHSCKLSLICRKRIEETS